MLTGSLVAIATPMQPGGALDLAAYRKLIDFHIANGTSAIVAVGTTGESPTVDVDEHCLLLKTAVEHAARRIPIIAGTGANSTSDLVRHVDLIKRLPREREFALYSGNDDTALAYLLLGGHGVISVTANVAPKPMSEMCAAARRLDVPTARAINERLMGLHTKLF